MSATATLAGRTVLIVHDDRFRGDYMADVLRGVGAVVIDPVPTAAAGMEVLRGLAVDALVLAVSLGDEAARALVRTAAERCIAMLAVRPAQADPYAADLGVPVLTSPCAGFQVAEALGDLLAALEVQVRVAGPVVRGH